MTKKPTNHLLVIRLSAMGDVAISVPVLMALTQQYPELRLTVLTRPLFAPLFAHLPNTEVFPIDPKGRHKGLRGLYRLFRELKALRIDKVADLHGVLRTHILRGFFAFSRSTKEGKRKKRLHVPKTRSSLPYSLPTCAMPRYLRL